MTDDLPPLSTIPWLGFDPERGDLYGFNHEEMREYASAYGDARAAAAVAQKE